MLGVQTPEGLMFSVHGAGKGKSTSVLLELDMAARVAVQVWYVESKGGTLYLNEGYRPAGVEADRYVRVASDTSTGGSNAWYQVGRADRGETPSALPPTGPNPTKHLKGRALDSNAPTTHDMKLRAEGAALVGLVFNVPSESWHEEPLLPVPSAVDLAPWIKFVQGVVTPTTPTPAPNNRLKEATTMFLVEETNGQKRVLLMSEKGATHLTKTEQVTAWQGFFAEMGLTGPGFSVPMKRSWEVITHASEGIQGKNAKA